MKQEYIIELALKILAIGCLVYALSHIGYYASFFFIEKLPPLGLLISSGVGPIIGPIISSIFLFLFAKKLSKIIIATDSKEVIVKFSKDEIHFILLSILGSIVIFISIFPLITYVATVILQQADQAVDNSIRPTAFLVAYVIQLSVGLWLAFGSKGIVGIIRKFRGLGN